MKVSVIAQRICVLVMMIKSTIKFKKERTLNAKKAEAKTQTEMLEIIG